ncbi:MAG: hypothetical protein LBS81_00835 [Endomicrobium sp.]|jgi:hypothetical protein|nr:hypothetical protein [Endomicrobium sp.]
MSRKDKNITPSVTQRLQNLGYQTADWDDSGSKLILEIQNVLAKSSKKQNGNPRFPDRIFINKNY